MNAARKRRLALQDRIKKVREVQHKKFVKDLAKIIRSKETPRTCFHGAQPGSCQKCMESRTINLLGIGKVRLIVLINELDKEGLPIAVDMLAPRDRVTQTIMDMQKNGFWCDFRDYPTFFPPHSILRAAIETAR